jgi:hypothetical protein
VTVPSLRNSVTYRVPISQRKDVEIDGIFNVKSVTIVSEMNNILQPHWRFGLGPQQSSIKLTRGTTKEGKPCVFLTVSSSLRVDSHGVVGHQKILNQAYSTFGLTNDRLLLRAGSVLTEKAKDVKVHASKLDMLKNGAKMLEAK